MIELRMLGTVSLTDSHGRQLRTLLGQTRRLALLAYLAAARPRGPQRRERLVAMFWPELDQDHARGALRQALHVLRTALGPDALATPGDDIVFIERGAVRCDVVDFEEAIATRREEEALELYGGDLLDAFFIRGAPDFERWVEDERSRLQKVAADAARALIDRTERGGDLPAATRWASRAARLAPFDDDVGRRLMSLLDRAGDPKSAVRAYEEFSRRIADELQAQPEGRTRALAAEIRTRQQAALVPATPTALSEPPPEPVEEAGLEQPPPLPPHPPARLNPTPRERIRRIAPVALAAAVGLALLLGGRLAFLRRQPESRASVANRSASSPTANAKAWDLYLLSKIRLHRENAEDNAAAIRLLEQTIAIDAGFAAAHAALALAYGLRFAQFAPDDSTALDRAQLALQKALRLEPNLPEAHFAAARLLWGDLPPRFAHERAISELKRALALAPNFAEAHHYLGMIFLHIGLLDEAEGEFQRTLSIDPTDDNALRRIGIARIYRGRYDEGLRTIRQVPPMSSDSLWNYQVAWSLLYLGRTDEAWTTIDRYLGAHPEDRGGVVTSTRAVWFAKAGDAAKAEADIQTAIERGKGFTHFHHSAYNIASAYALLRQPGPAVKWLRTAAETGWPCYPYFASDPNLERIRTDAEYSALMRELEVQWRRYRAAR